MLAIGLMSGTSLDGVDAVLVEIQGYSINTKVKVIDYLEYPMPKSMVEKIKDACSESDSSVDKICSLNFELGNLFSEVILALLNKANITSNEIDFIASHGQTIYHIPFDTNELVASTLQLGEAAILAYQHNTTVVSNFRVMDMAASGQGAPLVPYSEWILYSDKNKNIALQNLGGIGNVTILNSSLKLEDTFAFDTGPGNMMLNEACQILFNLDYDQDGKLASQGKPIAKMLKELMDHPYMKKQPPKSTGREEFGEWYVKGLIDKYKDENSYDIISTLTMFTASSMKYHYDKYLNNINIDEIVIGGGGSHNLTLLNYIKGCFAPINVMTQDEKGYSSDAKEAIAFVILANETLHQQFSNVKSATGAKDNVVLGNITLPPRGGKLRWLQKLQNMITEK